MFGNSGTSSGGGLFGASGSQANNTSNMFGAKPAQPSGFGAASGANTGFSFGSGSNNTSAPSGGLFGSNNSASNTTNPTSGTSGFGGGNTFGSSTTSGGLFGSSNNSNTSGGLFGSKPQAPASGGLFGANQNQTQQPASGGLFGSNPQQQQQQQQPASGGLFGGNQSQQPASGGLFGSTQNQNQSQSQQPATGGLFGGNSNTSGGLFGSKPAAPATGGGLFGSSNTSSTQPSGGLFGGNNNTSTQQSGGLFGGNSNSNSGGLFGSKPAAPATGGGLFGGSTTNNNTSGGLFGGNNNTSGGLFGGNNQQQQQQPQQQHQQQQQPSGGLFSNNTTNNAQPSFGWSSNQQQKPSVLSTQPLINNTNNQNSGPTNAAVNNNNNNSTYTPAINDQLIKIKEQWDPNSAKCVLKTHFYNKFNDQEISILLNQQRPSNETPEDWDHAMDKRPSASHYPIKVSSFTEVAQRIETQLDHVAKSRVLLNSINEKAEALSSKHDLDNTTRILKAKAKHTKLSRRLLRLATVLAILKLKGYPLLPEEEEISRQFDLLNAKLNDSNSPVAKLNDVFARLAILKERADDLNYQFDNSINAMSGLGEDTKDREQKDDNTEEIVNKLSKVLMKQQVGLNYLNDVLEKDQEKVATFIKK